MCHRERTHEHKLQSLISALKMRNFLPVLFHKLPFNTTKMDMHLKNNFKRGKKNKNKRKKLGSQAWPPSWMKLVNMSSKLDDVGYKYIILCLQTHEQWVINISSNCLRMIKIFRYTYWSTFLGSQCQALWSLVWFDSV